MPVLAGISTALLFACSPLLYSSGPQPLESVGVGFEPTVPFGTPVFKTGSFNRSDTLPKGVSHGRPRRQTAFFRPASDQFSHVTIPWEPAARPEVYAFAPPATLPHHGQYFQHSSTVPHPHAGHFLLEPGTFHLRFTRRRRAALLIPAGHAERRQHGLGRSRFCHF